jgi:two-component sensor histidine kinase
MTQGPDLHAILNSQPELAFILRKDGVIEFATDRSRSFVPGLVAGGNLFDGAADADLLRRFLSRCAGTSQKCIGSILLTNADGQAVRLRAYGLRLGGIGPSPRLFVRCAVAGDERFAFLARRVEDLNREVRKRRHLQALLEETLRDRELLVREMHHRVKNNIQMLAAMLHLAEGEIDHAEARNAVGDIGRRVGAIATIQQILYRADDLGQASAAALVGTLADHLAEILPPGVQIRRDVGDFPVPMEHTLPVALIVNELVTNAAKHGFQDGRGGCIEVRFRQAGTAHELSVRNPGRLPAIAKPERHASGLGLVKGLVRQLRGAFSVTAEDDRVVCRVSYVEQQDRGDRAWNVT